VKIANSSSSNTIGGNAAAKNTIAFNGGDGVSVESGSSTGNSIVQNSVYNNGGLGIDLGADGVTPNDLGDTDTGPNALQNTPLITSATPFGASIIIGGKLNSTPNRTFDIQFFRNPSDNEGKTFIAQKSVTTSANGNAPFAFRFAAAVPPGQEITATATRAGNTSEFSTPREVGAQ